MKYTQKQRQKKTTQEDIKQNKTKQKKQKKKPEQCLQLCIQLNMEIVIKKIKCLIRVTGCSTIWKRGIVLRLEFIYNIFILCYTVIIILDAGLSRVGIMSNTYVCCKIKC